MRTFPATYREVSKAPTPQGTRARWRGRMVAATAVGAMAIGGTASYTVQPGDTLSAIAARHGVSVDELATASGVADPNRIYAGDELAIPESSDALDSANEPDRDDAAVSTELAEQILEDTARDFGFSPRFVKALAWQESGWKQDEVSHAGAIGIMQVMPYTGEFVSDELAGRELDLQDPYDNVEAGVRFLQYLWELTDGDVELVLAGYYQGLASVDQNGWYDDTVQYVDNVLALRDRF